MGFCILSIDKIHSMGSLQVRKEHNAREINLSHIDTEKIEQNEELIPSYGMDYKDLWKKRMKEVEIITGEPVVKRKNSVLAYEIVLSFSRESDVDIEHWKELNLKWLNDTFGEENVLAADLHMDETTPHIHAIVVPIDERNHLCAKSFTGGRGAMFKLQNSYAKYMNPLGLERGKMYSRSKKQDLNRFYALLNEAVSATAPVMEVGEPVESYIERVNSYIQDEKMKALWAEENAKKEINSVKADLAEFKAHYKEAIILQDTIEENMNGNMSQVRGRLRTYQNIEKSVPRKVLATFLNNLINKFPPIQALRSFSEDKKKKKKNYFKEDGNITIE